MTILPMLFCFLLLLVLLLLLLVSLFALGVDGSFRCRSFRSGDFGATFVVVGLPVGVAFSLGDTG